MGSEIDVTNVLVTEGTSKHDILVSVIMPVYNVAKYLDECMTSLVNQTLKNIEIICVDDGSTDNSLEILKKYAENDDRIIVVTQKNQRTPVARNNGFKLARGKYVIHLDSDDFFEFDMLKLAYERAELTQAEICIFRGYAYDNGTSKRNLISFYDTETTETQNALSPEKLGIHLFEAVYVMPWNKLYLREFLNHYKLEFQKIRHSDDVSFVYTSVVLADKITFLNNALVNYRIGRGDSIQDNAHKSNSLIYFEAFGHLKNNLMNHGLYDKFKSCFANALCRDIAPITAKLYQTEQMRELHEYVSSSVELLEDLNFLNVNNLLMTTKAGFLVAHHMINLNFEQFLEKYEFERSKYM